MFQQRILIRIFLATKQPGLFDFQNLGNKHPVKIHRAFMYTIKWQKRGSPHMQMLLWLEQSISPNQSNILNEKKKPNYIKFGLQKIYSDLSQQ
jgi:hypothetical protein